MQSCTPCSPLTVTIGSIALACNGCTVVCALARRGGCRPSRHARSLQWPRSFRTALDTGLLPEAEPLASVAVLQTPSARCLMSSAPGGVRAVCEAGVPGCSSATGPCVGAARATLCRRVSSRSVCPVAAARAHEGPPCADCMRQRRSRAPVV